MNLSKNTKLIKVKAGQTTATDPVESDVVDMSGFEGVMFFGSVATANAGNFGKVQQGQQSNGGDMADLAGTKVVPGDSGDSFLIDVYRPRERYVRCVIIRAGTTTVTGDIYALLYRAAKAPTSQGATIDAEVHASPAEGTA